MKWIIEKITRCLNFLSPKLNTKIIFRLKMKRKLDLKEPTLFNDKIQYLKLKYYNSNKYIKELANKVTVRQHLDDIGMGKIKNDSFGIFNNAEDIPFNMLPNQFIIKWNFGSTLNYIVKDKKSENP